MHFSNALFTYSKTLIDLSDSEFFDNTLHVTVCTHSVCHRSSIVAWSIVQPLNNATDFISTILQGVYSVEMIITQISLYTGSLSTQISLYTGSRSGRAASLDGLRRLSIYKMTSVCRAISQRAAERTDVDPGAGKRRVLIKIELAPVRFDMDAGDTLSHLDGHRLTDDCSTDFELTCRSSVS